MTTPSAPEGEMTHQKRRGMRKIYRAAVFAVTTAAVIKELKTPSEERTWNGKVASFVPYDFRMPTIARAKERLWNPESDTYVGPRVFGVGWTVNVGKVVHTVKDRLESARS